MRWHRTPAVFMRGGTSKALIFRQSDLPPARSDWDPIFLAAMGVPDPNGRQLDGMGGGLSSLNKVCVVGAPTHPQADIDFTFAQLSINDCHVDYGGNCGNMSAAIGPFAVEEGLVPCPPDGQTAITLHNTNTGKLIRARFPVRNGALAPEGDLAINGVAGTAAPIRLEFLDPGGAKTGKLLPTGKPIDRLEVPGLGTVEASCIDATNPAVFVRAEALGMTGVELPEALERDAPFLMRMEAIRLAASVAMGVSQDITAAGQIASIPKVAMICPPRAAPTIAGEMLGPEETDVTIRMISVGQPHRAVPITGAVCLAVAACIPGTIPADACTARAGTIRVGHPSGAILVEAAVDPHTLRAEWGAVYRTARRLFEGQVVWRG